MRSFDTYYVGLNHHRYRHLHRHIHPLRHYRRHHHHHCYYHHYIVIIIIHIISVMYLLLILLLFLQSLPYHVWWTSHKAASISYLTVYTKMKIKDMKIFNTSLILLRVPVFLDWFVHYFSASRTNGITCSIIFQSTHTQHSKVKCEYEWSISPVWKSFRSLFKIKTSETQTD